MRRSLLLPVFWLVMLGCHFKGDDGMQLLEDGPSMREEILRHVPIGTPKDRAREIMERNGFACSIQLNKDHQPYLFCGKQQISKWPVERKWLVAIGLKDGRVSSVGGVTTGLVGP